MDEKKPMGRPKVKDFSAARIDSMIRYNLRKLREERKYAINEGFASRRKHNPGMEDWGVQT